MTEPIDPGLHLTEVLLGGPKLGEATAAVFADIEAERKADLGRVADLQA
jgi:hypothetical protein